VVWRYVNIFVEVCVCVDFSINNDEEDGTVMYDVPEDRLHKYTNILYSVRINIIHSYTILTLLIDR